jgi:hypothetical protein
MTKVRIVPSEVPHSYNEIPQLDTCLSRAANSHRFEPLPYSSFMSSSTPASLLPFISQPSEFFPQKSPFVFPCLKPLRLNNPITKVTSTEYSYRYTCFILRLKYFCAWFRFSALKTTHVTHESYSFSEWYTITVTLIYTYIFCWCKWWERLHLFLHY